MLNNMVVLKFFVLNFWRNGSKIFPAQQQVFGVIT